VDPRTGVAYIMTPERSLIPVRADKIQEKPPGTPDENFMLREQVEISFVPATPENIAALTDARDRMIFLRERLAKAFSQGEIGATLQKINSTLLALDGPEDAPTEASKSRSLRP